MRVGFFVGIPGLDATAGAGSAFRQDGPTLDLLFIGSPVTDPLKASTTSDASLGFNFTDNTYQVAAQYAIWE